MCVTIVAILVKNVNLIIGTARVFLNIKKLRVNYWYIIVQIVLNVGRLNLILDLRRGILVNLLVTFLIGILMNLIYYLVRVSILIDIWIVRLNSTKLYYLTGGNTSQSWGRSPKLGFVSLGSQERKKRKEKKEKERKKERKKS